MDERWITLLHNEVDGAAIEVLNWTVVVGQDSVVCVELSLRGFNLFLKHDPGYCLGTRRSGQRTGVLVVRLIGRDKGVRVEVQGIVGVGTVSIGWEVGVKLGQMGVFCAGLKEDAEDQVVVSPNTAVYEVGFQGSAASVDGVL